MDKEVPMTEQDPQLEAATKAGEAIVAAVEMAADDEQREAILDSINDAAHEAEVAVVDVKSDSREAREQRVIERLMIYDLARKRFGGNTQLAVRALRREAARRAARVQAREQ